MIARTALVPVLGLSLLLGAIATAAAPLDPPSGFSKGDDAPGQDAPKKAEKTKKAKLGEAAPDFALKDADGKEYKLSDHKGKIVVLQWINPDCPVCKRVTSSGLIERMVKDLKSIDKDIVHMAINSTHYMEPEVGAKYMKKHKLAAPALDDRDGKVGHLYGARSTPHMFVIDGKGILRYDGALDDDPRGGKGDGAANYVVNAVTQIVAGETVAPDSPRSYGCSVKYARGGGAGKGRRGRGG